MSEAIDILRAAALRAAANRLGRAAAYAEAHAHSPLFQRTVRRLDCPAVLVRLDWPGVLRVFDAATGTLLAESEPGKPGTLRAGFAFSDAP